MALDLFDSVLIDNHAHSLLKGFLQLDAIGFRKAFSESRSMSFLSDHAIHALHYQSMLKQLKEVVDFESEDQLIERRQNMSASEYVKTLWDDASIGALLIDDGFMSDSMLSVSELARACGRPLFRIVRIEPVLERLLVSSVSLSEVEKNLESLLLSGSSNKIVGLKTIAAYRGGLSLNLDVDRVAAEQNLVELKRSTLSKVESPTPFRITSSPLYHYLLVRAFQIAGQRDLPVQIHTGIGDSDLELHESNPSLLTPLLKSKRFASCRFVFLHCYPYVKEAAYLCSIFPNAYMDLSLSVNLASMVSRDIFREAMALASPTKILAGTDGHSVPETHWYGAVSTKKALSVVCDELVEDGYIDSSTALVSAERILFRNCRQLYDLEGLV